MPEIHITEVTEWKEKWQTVFSIHKENVTWPGLGEITTHTVSEEQLESLLGERTVEGSRERLKDILAGK